MIESNAQISTSGLRLGEHLRTIRHLPSGTPLPQFTDPQEQRLLADLLSLPEDVDPVEWLRHERGHMTTLMVMRSLLDRVRELVVGLQQATWYGWKLPAFWEVILGNFVSQPHAVTFFAQIDRNGKGEAAALREVLRELRIYCKPTKLMEDIKPFSPLTENQQIWVDLLVLPEDQDLQRWLQAENASLTARLALASLLNRCQPSTRLQIGPVRSISHPDSVLRPSRHLKIRIKEVVIGGGGGKVSAEATLSPRELVFPQGTHLFWPGFDQLADDRSNRYLVQTDSWNVSKGRLGRHNERIEMRFFPTVAPDASELIFWGSPATPQISAICPPGTSQPSVERITLPNMQCEEVLWRFSVR